MNDFSQPRRQEPIGIIVIFADNVQKYVRVLLAFVAVSIFRENVSQYLYVGIGLLVVLAAVFSFLQYRRFQFHIEGEELVLDKGIFVREKQTIPFHRIQTVNLTQTIIQQILGITGLKIDTAGSAKEELQIRALKKKEAEALQSFLDKAKEEAPLSERIEMDINGKLLL